MFGAPSGRPYPSRNVPPNPPGFNSGHNAFPNSYRNNPPLDDFEEDDDEWDESDEEVYENEHLPTRPPRTSNDRQPLPPARPPHNPPNEQPAMRSMHSNYPFHRPQNQAAPPIQPREDDQNDDMYLPIDGANSNQGAGYGREPPSLPRATSGFNNTTAVAPHRPSYPPPSSGRPPMPTPTTHAPPPTNPMLHDPYSSGSERSQRGIPASPRNSRNNRTSPRSSPGPPSRGSSDRSSGSRLPNRVGSGSSNDSVGSSVERFDMARPPPLPGNEQRSGGFEMFKTQNALPGFKSTHPTEIPLKGNMPHFSRPKPDKPAKPTSGFNQADRKPIPLPKPGKEPLAAKDKANKERPGRDNPVVNSINSTFANMLNHNLPKVPNLRSPEHGSHRPPMQLPQFSTDRVEQQVWFKSVTRQEAQTLIERRPREGCFIVRPGRDPNPYSLSVYSGGIVNLVIRQRSDMNYALGTEKENEKSFPSVVELIQYHMTTPLVLASGKGSVTLSDPA